MKEKMFENICIAPWNMLRIEHSGDCYICTSSFQKFNLGNIFEKSFEEIWNGDLISEVRKKIILEGDYSYCRTDLCHKYLKEPAPLLDFSEPDKEKIAFSKAPSIIFFAFDYSCNQKCVFCRDKVMMMNEAEAQKWLDVLEEKIFPIIKDVKYIEMNHAGEFLDGFLSEKLVSRVLELNPNIKFNIISNGVVLSQEKLKKINLEGRINIVHVSMHSATKETYKKIFRKDNFEIVLKNIEYLKELREKGKIKRFELMFVICSLNYKEIPLFIQLAKKYSAVPSFSLMNYKGDTVYGYNQSEYEIFSKEHIHYNDFVKVLKSKEVSEYIDIMPPILREIKPQTFMEKINLYIKTMKKKLMK